MMRENMEKISEELQLQGRLPPSELPRTEYLKEGVTPIITAVGTHEDFRAEPGDIQAFMNKFPGQIIDAKNVNYFAKDWVLKYSGQKNAGERSYVISDISVGDKYSEIYKNCTGVVVVGRDKTTKETISFLTHQDPRYFLHPEKQAQFASDLRSSLAEMKKRCEEGTLDARIFGGNYIDDRQGTQIDFKKDYLDSIRFLSQEVQYAFGFKPIVVAKPKLNFRGDSVYFKTTDRHLYLMRPTADDLSDPFLADDIKSEDLESEESWTSQKAA